MSESPAACAVCGERDHHTRRCPELWAPLREGFYKPSGGGGGHSSSDEEESHQHNSAVYGTGGGGHSHDDDDEHQKLEMCRTAQGPVGAATNDEHEHLTCPSAPSASKASLPRLERQSWDAVTSSICCV